MSAAEGDLLTADVMPRDLANRYRVYRIHVLELTFPGHPSKFELRLLASAPDAPGVGQALVRLAEEGEITPDDRVGLLDVLPGGVLAETGRWLISPWATGR